MGGHHSLFREGYAIAGCGWWQVDEKVARE
jgi:hypothetical protein